MESEPWQPIAFIPPPRMTLEDFRANDDLRMAWNRSMSESHMVIWLKCLEESFRVPTNPKYPVGVTNIPEFVGLEAFRWVGEARVVRAVQDTGIAPIKPDANKYAPTPSEAKQGFAHEDLQDDTILPS